MTLRWWASAGRARSSRVPEAALEAEAQVSKTNRPRASLKILFIGNSFTARNDLPGLVAAMAAANGDALDHRLISVGGASLRSHWNKGEATEAIRSGGYDYVVLQEQRTLPIKNPNRMHENIRLFDQQIKESGSKTALYLTWARRHAPESQTAITEAYTAIAEELGATLIPAGIAWQRFMRGHDRPVLHDHDGSHPTLAGTFLAACVAYATLFGRKTFALPEGIVELTEGDKKLLQRGAVEVTGGDGS